jgi:hypothetical protein
MSGMSKALTGSVLCAAVSAAILLLTGELHWGSGALVVFSVTWAFGTVAMVWRAHKRRVNPAGLE